MSTYNDHQILVNEILCELSKNINIRCWANSTGMAQAFNSERIVKFGLEGSADIIGVLLLDKIPLGAMMCFEIKTGGGRQSRAQRNFQKMIQDRGGFYFICRNIKDALKGVDYANEKTMLDLQQIVSSKEMSL